MLARLRLDLGWRDLIAGTLALLPRGSDAGRATRIETEWSAQGDALVSYSVRSALDLYLRAKRLPPGAEVLVSALTIPDMARVLRLHGLVPVPIDIDPDTLAPRLAHARELAGPKTVAVLVAHLFGTRQDLSRWIEWKRECGLELWEDAAQAFTGDDWRGADEADLALFSFGMIKTATALGGAIARVRDEAALAEMRRLLDLDPQESRWQRLRRLRRAALLLLFSGRTGMRLVALAARVGRRDIDDLLAGSARSFSGRTLAPALRKRPSAALLTLLERRLAQDIYARTAARSAAGESLRSALLPTVPLVGGSARRRDHWVVGVESAEPAELVERLRAAGFDATRRSSLVALGGERTSALTERLVFLPLPGKNDDVARASLTRALFAHRRQVLEPVAAQASAAEVPGAAEKQADANQA